MVSVRKMQYIVLREYMVGYAMARSKEETLSIRTSKEIKMLLKAAAEKEHHSQASMLEVLILDYAKLHGLVLGDIPPTNGSRG